MFPRPSLEFLLHYYETSGHGDRSERQTLESVLAEEARAPNSTVDARRIVAAMATLTPSTGRPTERRRFLDVGCGYGFYAREAQRCGFDVRALELAATERGIANAMLGVEPQAVSFEEFQPGATRFSALLMSQILEHALDVHEWIAKARSLLVPGGVLAVALPNVDSIYRRLLGSRDPFVIPPAHLNYFSPRSLRHLLESHGFVVRRFDVTSPIPRAALMRRFGVAAPAAVCMARVAFALADACGMGVMLNAYAVRGPDAPE